MRIVKISQLRNLLLIVVVVFSNIDLHLRVKSLRIASTFILSNILIMNALVIHLYPSVTFINLVIIRLDQKYRTIVKTFVT